MNHISSVGFDVTNLPKPNDPKSKNKSMGQNNNVKNT